MKFYSDLNMHLCAGESLGELLKDDLALEWPSMRGRVQQTLVVNGCGLDSANMMLFNQGLSVQHVESISLLCSEYHEKKIFLTLLASPDHITSYDQLESLKFAGVSAITFHSYHQFITRSKYARYAELASWAEDLKMPVLVDGSYGTLDMYNIDNLELVAYLASIVKSIPIIIMHSGGSRVLEAMLLAESTSNLFMDTSFTLPYYTGSSVENDLAFAYKKIGSERVVYGSDHPYISHDASLAATLRFFDKYNFSSSEQDWILKGTFSRLYAS